MIINFSTESSGSFDALEDSTFDQFTQNTQSNQNLIHAEFFLTIPKKICSFECFLQQERNQLKSFGDGGYEVSVEKDSDGKTRAGGSLSYESDNGTKIEVEAKVDNKGNSSGKVSVGGKF